MSKSRKKLRNKLARQVIDGEVTRAEALVRLGVQAARKSAVPSLAKADTARPAWPSVQRYPGDDEYVRSAFRPMPRPAGASVPAMPREHPLQVLKALKSSQMLTPAPDARPVRPMTPFELNHLREIEQTTDPQSREQARSYLIARIEGNVT